MKEETEMQKSRGNGILRKWFTPKVVIVAVVVAALCLGGVGLSDYVSSRSETVKIGFEDIGELATQAAYCREVNVTEASRDFFGITIPFTQSKYIYSYDVTIKAGFDFQEVLWELNDTTITVYLPEVKILSSELDLDSFQLYHEAESIFKQITLEETNDAMSAMVKSAEEDAVANGLLDEARSNAETILTGFFANVYDMEKYTIEFVDKE